jgi:hypothetical protein
MTTGLAPSTPKIPNPTAKQSVAVGQEMPFNPLTAAGITPVLHAKPAFCETTTALIPTAKQTAVLGQATELSPPVPVGGASLDHVLPPVVVAMIVEPAASLPEFPTAAQSADGDDDDGEEHEMLVRLTAFDGGD